MISPKEKRLARLRRKRRVRKKVFGTSVRPRLSVFRSLKHIYAQIIDDTKGATLVAASTLDPELRDKVKEVKGKIAAAQLVGKLIARRALEKGIKQVVFDRNGFLYHGRIKAVADAAREAGLEF
ncbi:MAG: 50S ribosomal protein L18 [Candidatus Desulfofervidaceae bacterium]|nr:50S ribosomal protein L18 [Candidatus Desulfofervidaceae bacterium]